MTSLGRDPDRIDWKATNKRLRKASTRQEKRTANSYKGARQPRSGAGWVKKNDVRSEHFLIENKLTENAKSYTVKFTDLRDLARNALREDRVPVLQFDLGGNRYVILLEDDFLEMIGD